MFGSYRTALALLVMAHHLLSVPLVGQYAVFSFFVLSGFLMTMIMSETYGHTPGGFGRYLLNRGLRLYPGYLFGLVLALAVIGWCGAGFATAYHRVLALPDTPVETAANLTMIFPHVVPHHFLPRLLPATWALTVEISFYILIGLGLSRTLRSSLACLLASLGYVAAMIAIRADYDYLYGAIPAGSLPFAAGACAWHMRARIHALLGRRLQRRARTLMAANLAFFIPFALVEWQAPVEAVKVAGLYLNVPLSVATVIALFHAPAAGARRRSDKLIGDYSYPVYLLHWPMGALAAFLLFAEPVRGAGFKAAMAFGLALILTLAASSAIVHLIDPAVARLRTALKRRKGNFIARDGRVHPSVTGPAP